MAKNHWLVKSEPGSYSWADFVKDGGTAWTGVRNFHSRNNLRAMKEGDSIFFYHSGEGKEIVGLGRVEKTAYPDPTAKEGDWSAVDLKPVRPFKRFVTLKTIRGDARFGKMALLRNSRLSVTPVTTEEAERLFELERG